MSRLAASGQELVQTVAEINTGAEATWRYGDVASQRTATAMTKTNWLYEPEVGPSIAFQESHTGYYSWDDPFSPWPKGEICGSLGVSARLADGRETTFSIITHPWRSSFIKEAVPTYPPDAPAEELLESIGAENSDEMLAILEQATQTGVATRVSASRGITFQGAGPSLRPYVHTYEAAKDGELTERYASVDQKRPADHDYRLFFAATIKFTGSTALSDELVYTNTELKGKFPPVTTGTLAMIGGLALDTFKSIRNNTDARNRDVRQVQRPRANHNKRGWTNR